MSFKQIKIKDLFEIKRGDVGTISSLKKGMVPLISSSENNMGVVGYYNIPNKYSNMLTISLNGACGFCAYHNYSFNINSDCAVLIPKFEIKNSNILIFYSVLINNVKSKFAYGYKSTPERLYNTAILVPVNSNNEPDYEFMEEYIKEREEKLKEKYKKHIERRIEKLSKLTKTKKEWGAIAIEDIFNILSGKRLTQSDMISGETPFVSAAAINNGVTAFIGNENNSLDKNVLGVNYDGNGGMAISFYHPYNCLFSDSVKRFHLKNYNDNKYVLLFLKQEILKQRVKYVYGYKFNETRMKKQKIMVPINSKGEPDYEYMKNYMKYLEQKKILEYLNYIN